MKEECAIASMVAIALKATSNQKPLFLVMQYLENLSDGQAAQAVQGRIDWKYALSLELTDPGFDFTVLSELGFFVCPLEKGE